MSCWLYTQDMIKLSCFYTLNVILRPDFHPHICMDYMYSNFLLSYFDFQRKFIWLTHATNAGWRVLCSILDLNSLSIQKVHPVIFLCLATIFGLFWGCVHQGGVFWLFPSLLFLVCLPPSLISFPASQFC